MMSSKVTSNQADNPRRTQKVNEELRMEKEKEKKKQLTAESPLEVPTAGSD